MDMLNNNCLLLYVKILPYWATWRSPIESWLLAHNIRFKECPHFTCYWQMTLMKYLYTFLIKHWCNIETNGMCKIIWKIRFSNNPRNIRNIDCIFSVKKIKPPSYLLKTIRMHESENYKLMKQMVTIAKFMHIVHFYICLIDHLDCQFDNFWNDSIAFIFSIEVI